MDKADYEARREARIDRLRNRAEKASQESSQLGDEAGKMAHCIPFGQPILVGHHSEKRDRNFRNRIHSKMSKSVELSKKAETLERRATSAESNRSISSDDPEAVQKLKLKLADLEKTRDKMKAMNKAWRTYKNKNDASGFEALGVSTEQINKMAAQIEKDYSWCKQPYPKFQMTNLGANIRTVKKRIERLSQESKREDSEKEVNGIKVVQNTYENRVQLIFPDKPAPEVRTILKREGFRWSPTNTAWQRQLNNAGIWAADRAVISISKIMYQEETGVSFDEADKQLFPEVSPAIKKQCSLCLWASAECVNKSRLNIVDGECSAYTYYD